MVQNTLPPTQESQAAEVEAAERQSHSLQIHHLQEDNQKLQQEISHLKAKLAEQKTATANERARRHSMQQELMELRGNTKDAFHILSIVETEAQRFYPKLPILSTVRRFVNDHRTTYFLPSDCGLSEANSNSDEGTSSTCCNCRKD